ncbi:unnamed protein product [Closterium sp. NIES-65]|nr:unnamed protein product [Closterium sp. NIES-65]
MLCHPPVPFAVSHPTISSLPSHHLLSPIPPSPISHPTISYLPSHHLLSPISPGDLQPPILPRGVLHHQRRRRGGPACYVARNDCCLHVTYSLPFSLTASFTTRGGGGQALPCLDVRFQTHNPPCPTPHPSPQVTYSLPFSLTASFTTRGGGGQGLAAGLLNIAIVLPQMFVSLVIGPFDAFFGGGNIPGFMAAAAFAAAAAAAAFFTLPRPPPDTPPPPRPSASRASLCTTSIPHWMSPPSASAPRDSLSNPFRTPPLHTSARRPDPVSPLSLPTCVSPIPPLGIKDSCSRSQ